MSQEDAPAQPASMRLRALSPVPLDSERIISSSGLVIGRDPEQTDLVFAAARVSRRHCRIQPSAQGCLIEDLASTNGVYVNGDKISGVVALRPGDVVGLGRSDPPDFELVGDTDSPRRIRLPALRTWRIGRSLTADIPIPADPTVSHQHAEISRNGDTLLIRDRGSLNGIRVKGKRIGRRRRQTVTDNACLELGNTSLTVRPLPDGGIDVAIAGRIPGLTITANHLGDGRAGTRSIDLSIAPGTLVGIQSRQTHHAVGMLGLLAGRLSPGQGCVMHNGQPAEEGTGGHRIGYVDAIHPLDGGLTVWQHLHYTARLRLPKDMDAGRREALLATTLAQLGLESLGQVRLDRLDAPHRRLVAIAAELVTRPALLCLDSPFTELDDERTDTLLKQLRKLARTGTTVLVTGLGLAERDAFDLLIELDQQPSSEPTRRVPTGHPATPVRARGPVRLHRIGTLLSRQCRLRLLDPSTLVLYLLLPLLLTLAATALAGQQYPLTLVMMIVAMATALFTAAPEIGADRWRLRHEVQSGVLPGEDLVARMLLCWLVGLTQMLMTGSGMAWLSGMSLTDASALVSVMILVSFSATTLGLMIGTIDPTRARLVMPLAAAFVILQWIVATGSAPDMPVTGWLFGRVREILPAWWGAELLATFHHGVNEQIRQAIRAGAFLAGQAITWMLIARGLLGRQIRQPLR